MSSRRPGLLATSALVGLVGMFGCASESSTTEPPASPAKEEAPPAGTEPVATPDPDLADDLITARPYPSKAPKGYDGTTALPLVLALHGRGDNGANFVKASYLLDLVEEKNFLLAYPSGKSILGASGWAAMGGVSGAPDDVKYLRAVIADMGKKFKVDPERVLVFGLSLGGFMANYLACAASDKVTGIVSLAGSLVDSGRCAPARATNITLLHGTLDETVPYEGGTIGLANGDYPAAPDLFKFWSEKNGCTGDTPVGPLDIDSTVAGAETTGKTRACRDGTSLTFLTVTGGPHVFDAKKAAVSNLIDGLTSKPRKP